MGQQANRWWLVSMIFVLILAVEPACAGTKWALLVGVSGYAPPIAKLIGPGNDVLLMREVLEGLGYQNERITILSDVTPGASRPTRAAILAELDRLERESAAGDEITVHVAAHGTRQPSRPEDVGGRSPDGFDAIILPIDHGRWNGGAQEVENAIANHEIRAWLDRVRARGVFVWLIFDACHSANMTRGDADDVRWRGTPPQTLGIPASMVEVATARAPRTRSGDMPPPMLFDPQRSDGQGDFVAFFAAQSTEAAPEYGLPRYQPGNRNHGLLTFTVARAVAANPGASFGQIAQQVLHAYAAGGFATPTPLFTGTGLKRSVSGAPTVGGGQWLARRTRQAVTVAAGSLHLLTPGSLMVLLPDALADERAALGYAEVGEAGLTQSTLIPVPHREKPAVETSTLPRDFVARLVEPRPDLVLRVARPTPADSVEAALVAQVLDQLGGQPGPRLAWVDPDQPADTRLLVRDGRLWFLPADGTLVTEGPNQTVSIHLNKSSDILRPLISETLARVAKVVAVARLAAQTESVGLKTVEAVVTVREGGGGRPIRLGDGAMPTVRDGDRLDIVLDNRGDHPVDFTVLQVTPQYGIHVVFPRDGEHNRIEAGARKRLPASSFRVPADARAPAGLERLLVIGVQAEPGGALSDFSFLAQPELPLTRGGDTAVARLLTEAGWGAGPSRGGEREAGMNRVWLRMFGWRIQP